MAAAQHSPVTSYPAWDFAALDKAVEKPVPAGAPRVVLLTTGAMNPVHRGHVAMLEAAARQIDAAGRGVVVGAFLSPSHDLYLTGKFGPGKFLPATTRLACASAALAGHPLVRLGAWEAQQQGRWPDFPVVCRALSEELERRYPAEANIRLFYVCGEDHYRKCGLTRGISARIGVCVVGRDGREASMAGADPQLVIPVAADAPTAEFSSTKVRAAIATLDKMLPPGVLEVLLAAKARGGGGDDE
eukprot:CAMPEP_0174831966 /NCGR_PEP_ID=MMETSP1114-20130205/3410_1 /TAXON_ID=312471 /ORGANISM="Neobodo designis, Strain CCAP 1951/1" /LENGTH=243 /DNA_ID=CAMNT_0016065815 /DNA_START=39 /DNA_END=770 /DNA_ORIENTATION=+